MLSELTTNSKIVYCYGAHLIVQECCLLIPQTNKKAAPGSPDDRLTRTSAGHRATRRPASHRAHPSTLALDKIRGRGGPSRAWYSKQQTVLHTNPSTKLQRRHPTTTTYHYYLLLPTTTACFVFDLYRLNNQSIGSLKHGVEPLLHGRERIKPKSIQTTYPTQPIRWGVYVQLF